MKPGSCGPGVLGIYLVIYDEEGNVVLRIAPFRFSAKSRNDSVSDTPGARRDRAVPRGLSGSRPRTEPAIIGHRCGRAPRQGDCMPDHETVFRPRRNDSAMTAGALRPKGLPGSWKGLAGSGTHVRASRAPPGNCSGATASPKDPRVETDSLAQALAQCPQQPSQLQGIPSSLTPVLRLLRRLV
jgi:hypothetical protein